MPHFFDPNNLSAEQKARWDQAIVKYNQVMRANEERKLGRTLTDEEWVAATQGDALHFPSYQPGHPKSALFFRLLEGKEPLPYAPPCAFSYPWYDTVETRSAMVGVMVDFPKAEDEISLLAQLREKDPSHPAIGIVWIEQTPWEILERAGDDLTISFGEWRVSGHRWKLSRVTVPATESAQSIVCHHDTSKATICNREDLLKESRYHVMLDIESLRESQETLDRAPTMQEAGNGAGKPASSMQEWTKLFRMQHARKTIEARVGAGLPPIPVAAEIEQWVEERYAQYLASDGSFGRWIVDPQGLLHLECWELESIAPCKAAA